MATINEIHEWLSPNELADWLGVPVASVYQWRHHGTGPAGIKVGRHVRYRRSEVEAWIERLRCDASAPARHSTRLILVNGGERC
jgi:excisionase family DNA binding protein